MSVAGASWWWMRRRIRTRPDPDTAGSGHGRIWTRPDLDTTGAEWLRGGGGKCRLQAGPLGDLLLAELVGGIPQRQSRMMRPVHIRAVKRADVAAPAQDAAERKAQAHDRPCPTRRPCRHPSPRLLRPCRDGSARHRLGRLPTPDGAGGFHRGPFNPPRPALHRHPCGPVPDPPTRPDLACGTRPYRRPALPPCVLPSTPIAWPPGSSRPSPLATGCFITV